MQRFLPSVLRVASTSRAPASSAFTRAFMCSAHRSFGTAQSFLERTEVNERVLKVLSDFDKIDSSKVTDTSKFTDDLGLDSLDVVEVVMAMEEEFVIEIPDDEADKLLTAAQVVDYIAAHPMAK